MITAKNFVCPSLLIAKTVNLSGGNSWVYQFNRVRDDPKALKYGAFHGAELPYVFDTHDEWLPTNKTDKELTSAIQSYWLSFAKTGNPNGNITQIWPAYEPINNPTLVLDKKIFPRAHESSNICKAMKLF